MSIVENELGDVLVLGDSWAFGEDEANPDSCGWVDLLGIADHHRWGVKMATAQDWSSGELSSRLDWIPKTARRAIVSIGGNDFNKAASDGVVDPFEFVAIYMALCKVRRKLEDPGLRLVVLLYANPYPDDPNAAKLCEALNQTIIQAFGGEPVYYDCGKFLTEPDDIQGFHPSAKGHAKIAEGMRALLASLPPWQVDDQEERK